MNCSSNTRKKRDATTWFEPRAPLSQNGAPSRPSTVRVTALFKISRMPKRTMAIISTAEPTVAMPSPNDVTVEKSTNGKTKNFTVAKTNNGNTSNDVTAEKSTNGKTNEDTRRKEKVNEKSAKTPFTPLAFFNVELTSASFFQGPPL